MPRSDRVAGVLALVLLNILGPGRAAAGDLSATEPGTVIAGSAATTPRVEWGGGTLTGEVTLVGVLRDEASGRPQVFRPVVLEVRTAGASEWKKLAEVYSRENGSVQHTPKPLQWSSEFRWNFLGAPGVPPAVGSTVKVAVIPAVGLCCGGTVKLGKSHSMNGFLGPKSADLTAVLQLKSGSTWKTVATCRTTAKGVCPLSVKPTKVGSYSYRLYRAGDAKLATKTSAAQTVKVTA